MLYTHAVKHMLINFNPAYQKLTRTSVNFKISTMRQKMTTCYNDL